MCTITGSTTTEQAPDPALAVEEAILVFTELLGVNASLPIQAHRQRDEAARERLQRLRSLMQDKGSKRPLDVAIRRYFTKRGLDSRVCGPALFADLDPQTWTSITSERATELLLCLRGILDELACPAPRGAPRVLSPYAVAHGEIAAVH